MELIVFGLGYTGAAISAEAAASGLSVAVTSRDPAGAKPPLGVRLIDFAAAAAAIREATHIVSTAPPAGDGGDAAADSDPVLRVYGAEIAAAPRLRWLGYVSTTGVYGDRRGGWVDEHTAPAPGQERSRRRHAAEQEWAALADRRAVDVFRTAGIYGPGRSALDDVRAGRARRIVKADHRFGRIHRDDIAGAVLAAARQDRPAGVRVLHLSDDVPASAAEVVEAAARLLGSVLPAEVDFAAVAPGMNEMARSFWAENRRVSSVLTQQWLDRRWRYPSFREGLAAILADETTAAASERAAREVRPPAAPG